jgi:hypothetical protein
LNGQLNRPLLFDDFQQIWNFGRFLEFWEIFGILGDFGRFLEFWEIFEILEILIFFFQVGLSASAEKFAEMARLTCFAERFTRKSKGEIERDAHGRLIPPYCHVCGVRRFHHIPRYAQGHSSRRKKENQKKKITR